MTNWIFNMQKRHQFSLRIDNFTYLVHFHTKKNKNKKSTSVIELMQE